jgi:hypothetical protein
MPGGGVHVLLEFTGSGTRNPMEDAVLEVLKTNLKVKRVINETVKDTVRNTGNGSVQLAYGRKGVR